MVRSSHRPRARKAFELRRVGIRVLQNTFCHLPRLGETSEQRLWSAGILTWKDFLEAQSVPRISDAKKPWFDRQLRLAQKAVFDGDSAFFTCLPSTQAWRLWEEFGNEAAFVDIETNYRQNITVLGIADAEGNVYQFVRHHNLDGRAVRDLLRQYKLLVTFNGASFDLPIIRQYFNGVLPDVPHIDLRWAAQRAGYTGGLKRVEKALGIGRDEEVEGVTGADALQLWAAYRNTGNETFRDLLLEYNAADIVNLKPLADIVYDKLRKQLLGAR